MTKSNNPKVRMPSEKWFGLDTESKAIWDRLDDKAKSPFRGQDNLREILAYDFLQANMHDVAPPVADHDSDEVPADPDPFTHEEANDIRLINAAKSNGNGSFPLVI